jgi:hypothetical protein
MNNPTLLDKLTGQIPGKTEGVSLLTLIIGVLAAAVHMIWGIQLGPETLTIINTVAMGGLGLALGSRAQRLETTTNQIQASQTASSEAVKEELKK